MKLLTPDPSPAEVTIPLFLHRACCGFPSPASDYLEGKLDLNPHCAPHPAATFYLRAEGESMTGVGIFPGDLLVVDKSLIPRHSDVVIALLDGGFMVKTLQLKPRLRLRLLPANPAFAPIDPCMSLSLELFGVVTHVIGNPRQRDGHSAR
ncbi:translesion error-prone DNA polymerase V autoproteolytic subunit [Aeromonas caviae]|uniref:Translesion error-prone DNA polymerase V autoproteolytic subunit n=1 Tax=Aeromonas caviae TaxID=648 RepID=A0A7T3X5X0_AERCA|nr:translesion error-prone DNA polymerase V autoproteolytic subunit [Aeromonas caviae]QQA62651.1 translesion error-prone DNA polymerase V autoproteolytic subunit [Aeromonas caviae]